MPASRIGKIWGCVSEFKSWASWINWSRSLGRSQEGVEQFNCHRRTIGEENMLAQIDISKAASAQFRDDAIATTNLLTNIAVVVSKHRMISPNVCYLANIEVPDDASLV